MTSDLISLPARSIIRLAGDEARNFLQGVVTANMRHLAPDHALYSALLSPQGKMQADFFVVEAQDGRILLDVDEARAATLLGMLKIYKLRTKITIEDVSAAYHVLAALDGAPANLPEGCIAYADPRTALFGEGNLGARILAPRSVEGSTDVAMYEARRIALGLMDGARDYTPDRSLALELGLDQQNAIDYTKGCYVGQEVTNRSKHRATLRKILGRVESVDGTALPEPGTVILAGDKEAGELHSSLHGKGLAQLRIEEIQAAHDAGAPITANGVALNALLPV